MKKYFLTGLVILLPVALTLVVIVFLVDLFTTPFVPIVSALLRALEHVGAFAIPDQLVLPTARALALILLCLFILFLGALTRSLFAKEILRWGEQIFSHIPFLKTVYTVSKDIFAALFSSDGKKAFKASVTLPFPFAPVRAIGFQSGSVAEEIQSKVKEPLTSVFMPTAPHPISGFLLFMPEKDVHTIAMSTEETVKFLVSCGLINTSNNTPL
jgi:uncharacterized membrane protein